MTTLAGTAVGSNAPAVDERDPLLPVLCLCALRAPASRSRMESVPGTPGRPDRLRRHRPAQVAGPAARRQVLLGCRSSRHPVPGAPPHRHACPHRVWSDRAHELHSWRKSSQGRHASPGASSEPTTRPCETEWPGEVGPETWCTEPWPTRTRSGRRRFRTGSTRRTIRPRTPFTGSGAHGGDLRPPRGREVDHLVGAPHGPLRPRRPPRTLMPISSVSSTPARESGTS